MIKVLQKKKRKIANYTMSLFRQSEAESMTVFALKLSRLTFDLLVFAFRLHAELTSRVEEGAGAAGDGVST